MDLNYFKKMYFFEYNFISINIVLLSISKLFFKMLRKQIKSVNYSKIIKVILGEVDITEV